jgi:mannose-1-phosphate guanylyltransferase
MVLAAGFGTRLRPLTDELPKPLLPIGDRSLLEHAIESFRGAGLGDSLLVNVHHLASEFERRRAGFSAPVELVFEPTIRGTAGGIAGARARLGPTPIAVMIGDALLDAVPAEFAPSASDGGLVLAARPCPPGSGTLGVGAEGQVVRLRGERFGHEVAGGEYVGLCALGARALADLPELGCLIGDYALPVLRSGGRVSTFPFLGQAHFPGDDVPGLFQANLRWLERHQTTQFVAPSARIARHVALERALVGEFAEVEGQGTLSRVLVLPRAKCRAPLSDAIVLPSGLVINLVNSMR